MFEAMGWILAAALAVVTTMGIAFTNHFECGGTLGGFGESATARLDKDCAAARRWYLLIPTGVFVAALVLRLLVPTWLERRKREMDGAARAALSGRRGARGEGR